MDIGIHNFGLELLSGGLEIIEEPVGWGFNRHLHWGEGGAVILISEFKAFSPCVLQYGWKAVRFLFWFLLLRTRLSCFFFLLF